MNFYSWINGNRKFFADIVIEFLVIIHSNVLTVLIIVFIYVK